MATQRILLALAVLAALALVFLVPHMFEETDEAGVPPVQLRDSGPAPPQSAPRPPDPTPAPPPPPPPPPADDDDGGGDDDDGDDDGDDR
jgi:hypothetical protein